MPSLENRSEFRSTEKQGTRIGCRKDPRIVNGKHTGTRRSHQDDAHLLSNRLRLDLVAEAAFQLLNTSLQLSDSVLQAVDDLVRNGSHCDVRRGEEKENASRKCPEREQEGEEEGREERSGRNEEEISTRPGKGKGTEKVHVGGEKRPTGGSGVSHPRFLRPGKFASTGTLAFGVLIGGVW